MQTNDLYQDAAANVGAEFPGSGVAKRMLSDGSELFCVVKRVAGRSQVKGHHRVNWRVRSATEQYSKAISRKQAVALLKAQ